MVCRLRLSLTCTDQSFTISGNGTKSALTEWPAASGLDLSLTLTLYRRPNRVQDGETDTPAEQQMPKDWRL